MTAREFLLPDIGEGLVEVQIERWLVPVGEHVGLDQPLVEVETVKAVTEIPSPFAGTLLHQGAREGETLEVGKTLAVIGEPGDAWPPSGDRPAEEGSSAQPIVGTLSGEPELLPPIQLASETTGSRPRAMPLVRKLAEELQVDLADVAGTGPSGRITAEDVRRRAETQASSPTAEATSSPSPAHGGQESLPTRAVPVSASAKVQSTEDERRPLGRVRRAVAANLSRSWAEIPQATAFDEVDATRLLAAREALEQRHATKLSIDALAVAALVPALQQENVFNARLDGDHMIYHASVDIGIAVDTPEGVMIGVIHDAGALGLLDIAAEIYRLRDRARSRNLTSEEVSGQRFTLTNIGAARGGWGTPLVPAGTTAILSIGQAKPRPVVRRGSVEVAPVMPLSLSFDHRVADGAVGRRFLALVVENLSEPALFLA